MSESSDLERTSHFALHSVIKDMSDYQEISSALMNKIDVFVFLFRADGRLLFANEACSHWLNVHPDMIHRQNYSQFFDGESAEVFRQALEKLREEKLESFDFELETRHAAKIHHFMWTIKPFERISARRGEIFVAMGRDETPLVAAISSRAKLLTELEYADTIQQTLFPPRDIENGNLRVANFCKPAENCSGDWLNHFSLKGGLDLICIADVTGHGPASALVTSATDVTCRNFINDFQQSSLVKFPLKELLSRLNLSICEAFKGKMNVTFAAALFEAATGTVTVSRGGHPHPLLMRADDKGEIKPMQIEVEGNPLGSSEEETFHEVSITMRKGERLVLYSDGMIESKNMDQKIFNALKFKNSLKRYSSVTSFAMRDGVYQDILDFCGEFPLQDDLTLVIAELK